MKKYETANLGLYSQNFLMPDLFATHNFFPNVGAKIIFKGAGWPMREGT